jgi:hypothetical protein
MNMKIYMDILVRARTQGSTYNVEANKEHFIWLQQTILDHFLCPHIAHFSSLNKFTLFAKKRPTLVDSNGFRARDDV